MRQSFVVTRAWNLPKRYLIRSYFEPRVSDRSVSYPQVSPLYLDEGQAADFFHIWDRYPTMATPAGFEPAISTVTGWRDSLLRYGAILNN